jgi:hypothetical protein
LLLALVEFGLVPVVRIPPLAKVSVAMGSPRRSSWSPSWCRVSEDGGSGVGFTNKLSGGFHILEYLEAFFLYLAFSATEGERTKAWIQRWPDVMLCGEVEFVACHVLQKLRITESINRGLVSPKLSMAR